MNFDEVMKLLDKGMSTYKIAEHLNKKPSTIRKLFSRRGIPVYPRSLGARVEESVERWARNKGTKVVRQLPTARYDLLVDDKRIDVKSAHKNNYLTSSRYMFQLYGSGVRNGSRKTEKEFSLYIDFFWLVFLEEKGTPIYELNVNDVKVKYMLSIKNPQETKYELKFLGYLGDI